VHAILATRPRDALLPVFRPHRAGTASGDFIACVSVASPVAFRASPSPASVLRPLLLYDFGADRMAWTDEKIAQLKKCWAKGLSASQIAEAIGGGITRNAVIGKLARLGLQLKGGKGWPRGPVSKLIPATPRRTKAKAAIPPPWKARLPKSSALIDEGSVRPQASYVPYVEEVEVPKAERKGVADLEANDCRWPIGDPGDRDFHFCNRKQHPGLPYCEHHVRVAYIPANPARKSAKTRKAPARIPTYEDA